MKKRNSLELEPTKLFLSLENALIDLKYEELTPEQRRQIEADAGIDMPKLKRVELTQEQVAFIRHYDHGYTVKFYTGYIPKDEDFVAKDIYGMQVAVNNTDKQLVYFRQIYRKGDFVTRAILEAKFVHHLLSNLPLSKNKSRMLLVRDKRGIPILRSSTGREEKSILDVPSYDVNVRKAAMDHWRSKRYYSETGRKKRGVNRTISDIKKKSKVNNPDGF